MSEIAQASPPVEASVLHAGGPWLLLDASGPLTRVGVWQSSKWLAYLEDAAPSLEALFSVIPRAPRGANLKFPEIAGFLYVEGPGSVLGLRLAAMAIRAWQSEDALKRPDGPRPVLACGSLPLAAALLLASGAKPPVAICSESRQGCWNLLRVPEENLGPAADLVETTDEEMRNLARPVYHLPSRKNWGSPPPGAQNITASLRDYPAVISMPGLFSPRAQALPWSLHPPAYREWHKT